MDEVARVAAPGSGFDQLSPYPGCARAGGDIEVDQLATLVADEKEDVESSVGRRLDDQKIGSPDTFDLVR